MYTDWRKDNYFQAVKEAIGNPSEFETSTFKIGIECDHMSVQISEKLQNLYDGRRTYIYEIETLLLISKFNIILIALNYAKL